MTPGALRHPNLRTFLKKKSSQIAAEDKIIALTAKTQFVLRDVFFCWVRMRLMTEAWQVKAKKRKEVKI